MHLSLSNLGLRLIKVKVSTFYKNKLSSGMQNSPSIFAQIVDKVRFMNEEQQKLLWLQLNRESIFTAALKSDLSVKGKNTISMDDLTKLTRHVRRQKKKA